MTVYRVALPIVGKIVVEVEADDADEAEALAVDIWAECKVDEEISEGRIELSISNAFEAAILELPEGTSE